VSPRIRNEGSPKIEPASDFDEQSDDDEQVSDERGQHRCPCDGFEFFIVENVDEQGGSVSAAGESNAAHNVEADPKSPGPRIVEIRYRSESEDHPDENDSDSRCREGEEHQSGGSDSERPLIEGEPNGKPTFEGDTEQTLLGRIGGSGHAVEM
jgi:hypothetical protein